jgi:hypothetical protein
MMAQRKEYPMNISANPNLRIYPDEAAYAAWRVRPARWPGWRAELACFAAMTVLLLLFRAGYARIMPPAWVADLPLLWVALWLLGVGALRYFWSGARGLATAGECLWYAGLMVACAAFMFGVEYLCFRFGARGVNPFLRSLSLLGLAGLQLVCALRAALLGHWRD